LRRRAVEVHVAAQGLLSAARRDLSLPGRALTRISARELAGSEGPFGRGVEIVRPDDVPEGSVVTVMRVPPEAAGMRLDRFVQSQLKRTSRTRAQVIVERGAYSPEARRLRGNDRVRAEQHILLWRAPWDEKTPDVELTVLYEDDHLLAIDKPAGMAVHPTARYHKSTVVKLLEAQRGEALKLSHRIDRETSGVLLLAKTSEADRHVKAQFEERQTVTKKYLAITWGAPSEDHFDVDVPLELDPTSRYKVKMRVAAPGTGLASRTRFEVIGRQNAFDTGKPYAMLRCTLETGRQHQIRVHLVQRGTPIVGDKLYGPDEDLFARGVDGELTDEDLKVLEIERHALHAALLELDHPITGARVRIESPLPDDLATFWRTLAG
jgi:23S rRNA pseudouridine1911/1915/1917 synthase